MLFDDISSLSGVGAKRVLAFHKLGIEKKVDLLFHLPRRYEDRRMVTQIGSLEPDRPVLIEGSISSINSKSTKRGVSIHRAMMKDSSGEIEVVFFGQDYILERFKPGMVWTVYGNLLNQDKGIGRYIKEPQFSMKEVDVSGKGTSVGKGTILSVYPATSLTPQRLLRKYIRELIAELKNSKSLVEAPDYKGMPSFIEGTRMIHMPRSLDEAEEGRKRLAMDELVTVRLCVEKVRRARPPIVRPDKDRELNLVIPFDLTVEQARIRTEILEDMDKDQLMRRLVEGDVGSGKTILAILAAIHACSRNQKVVFLAPTEILAEQHFLTWGDKIKDLGLHGSLLTGSVKGNDRKEIYAAAESNEAGIFFGTHALMSAKLKFKGLGLVVIDEQQRFGVGQREAILSKGVSSGQNPDLLILTATPIPRTLAMTLYGDLNISTLLGRLPGREAVETIHLSDSRRKNMMPLIRAALKREERVYFVYPIIYESEEHDMRDALGQHKKIQKAFPKHNAELLTGKTKSTEKERIMRGFRDGKIQLLIATSVVEVGIDVPEASLMVIEHADHFGLSQLHQLRGRVGRSGRKGTCILTTTDELGDYAIQRITTMVECQDGFEIAEEDLILRGPGEILGERQHGGNELRVARLGLDGALVKEASDYAKKILELDPQLETQEFLNDMAKTYGQSGADVI